MINLNASSAEKRRLLSWTSTLEPKCSIFADDEQRAKQKLKEQGAALRATLAAKQELAAKMEVLELAKLGRTGAYFHDRKKRESMAAYEVEAAQEATASSDSYYRNTNVVSESPSRVRPPRSPSTSPRTVRAGSGPRRLSISAIAELSATESATEGEGPDGAPLESSSPTRRLLFDTRPATSGHRRASVSAPAGRRPPRPKQSVSTPMIRPPRSRSNWADKYCGSEASTEHGGGERAGWPRLKRTKSFTMLKGFPSLQKHNIKSEIPKSDINFFGINGKGGGPPQAQQQFLSGQFLAHPMNTPQYFARQQKIEALGVDAQRRLHMSDASPQAIRQSRIREQQKKLEMAAAEARAEGRKEGARKSRAPVRPPCTTKASEAETPADAVSGDTTTVAITASSTTVTSAGFSSAIGTGDVHERLHEMKIKSEGQELQEGAGSAYSRFGIELEVEPLEAVDELDA